METKEKSREIAQALSRKVLEDIGRQFCRQNLERSVSRRIQRERCLLRVLETVNLGGFKHEDCNSSKFGNLDTDLLISLQRKV